MKATQPLVLLVNMPWASLDRPSLSLAALTDAVRRDDIDFEVETISANLLWARWLLDLDEPVSPDHYDEYGLDNYFLGFGDWVFTSALYEGDWKIPEFEEHARTCTKDPEAAVRLHHLAGRWIESVATEIAAKNPAVVGFTTTFQQTIASLAMARALKRLDPSISTVFGGANCDGEQGAALQRNFPHLIDYVVRGEGEVFFPRLLQSLGRPSALAEIPGLCWTDPTGLAVAQPMAKETVDLSTVGPPRYDEYYELLQATGIEKYVTPRLVLESSRGCWWGQKHHCTFCGLNGTYMTYRSKSQEQFLEELRSSVERYEILDIYVVDNILDMKYFQRLLPALADLGWDLHIQYEIKSSLRRHQLEALSAAGAQSLQPGVESLDTRVLKLMDKGVTGPQNIRLLREGKNVGLDVHWNYLYGFPGEVEDDYTPVLDQMPSLFHLQPPRVASPIAVERFSPYFSDPSLGFPEIVPAGYYFLLFDLPLEELFDLAYLFDAKRQGITGEVERRLVELTDQWREAFYTSRFVEVEVDDGFVLLSQRPTIPWLERRLTGREASLWRLLHEPSRVTDLAAAGYEEPELIELLDRWVADGMVFANKGQYVSLATEPSAIEAVSNSRAAHGLPQAHAEDQELVRS